MLHYIKSIKNVDAKEFSVECLFNNETTIRRIPMWKLINEYVNTPQIMELLQPQLFSEVSIDSYGTLVWSNGIDFCPDVLYNLSELVGD